MMMPKVSVPSIIRHSSFLPFYVTGIIDEKLP